MRVEAHSHRFHETGEAIFTNDFSFTFGCFGWIWFQIGFYISVWLLTSCGGWQRSCMVDLLINDKFSGLIWSEGGRWFKLHMHCYSQFEGYFVLEWTYHHSQRSSMILQWQFEFATNSFRHICYLPVFCGGWIWC